MGTTAIITLITSGLALLGHFIPRRSSSSTPTPTPTPTVTPKTSDDSFSIIPFGIPGHPILNALFGHVASNAVSVPSQVPSSVPAISPSPAIVEALLHAGVAGFSALVKNSPALLALLNTLTQPAASTPQK